VTPPKLAARSARRRVTAASAAAATSNGRGSSHDRARIGHAERVTDLAEQPDWFKDAVIYELHVRAFGDSNGDGIGDFEGMTTRLDYLQQLGVTALWILPFYPSPLRDDGYDIADYGGINPTYGDLRAFRHFLKEAHARDLRVITELVLNHTSDQHPWFQRARRAPAGSRYRDFYMWSDTPDTYKGVRVIFEDYEASNWSWDPVAGQYFFHRFFHHQPDLNYDNPEVRDTMMRAVDKWFEMGVDGVRLDAVPYLFAREGTSCENLPETHGFLKELRAHVDARFPNRMLLAEANQWPEDAVAYFGDPSSGGDECHMAFHFPLMPRLYMALRMEDRFPVIDILDQTPEIPSGAQWAIFLRNHDELTLEMVTDEERDYMYRAYAADPQMRVNVGIRRRLAPLLGNDRRKIELMNALLFSLPGTPVLYYGDEIGMGDNVYLGDRDSVRTPMQWSPDRNAGFSAANPHQLYLPTIIDPEYHFQTVNVESQLRNPHSLLWWMRRIMALRAQHTVFGRGSIEFLYPENAKVLAYLRADEHERILVVANLSRFAQQVTLDLHEHRGYRLTELFGRSDFGAVHDGPVSLTLGPYGFYWFSLVGPVGETTELETSGRDLPVLKVGDDWRLVFEGRTKTLLERVLPAYLEGTRWFGGKARRIRAVEVLDAVPMFATRQHPGIRIVLAQVEYTEGDPEAYVLPLTVTSGERALERLGSYPNAGVAWLDVEGSSERLLLFDALIDGHVARPLLDAAVRRKSFTSPSGATIHAAGSTDLRRVVAEADDLAPALSTAEQSNSSVIFGHKVVAKVFRRAQKGVNPDLELGRHLTEQGFAHAARLLGSLEYHHGRDEPRTLAVLTEYVHNEGDLWHYTTDALGLFYEDALTGEDPELDARPWDAQLEAVGSYPPPATADSIGPFLDTAHGLGRRTAELHVALATGDGDAFEPEPFTALYQRSLFQSLRSQTRATVQLLRRQLPGLEPHVAALAEELLAQEEAALDTFAAVTGRRFDATRIRIHGDYHLGQVLLAGRDFVIIDFEGEPSKSPSERRLKRSSLVDVAGMVRSFDYASRAALDSQAERGVTADPAALAARAAAWRTWVTTRFLTGYLEAAGDASFLPADPEERRVLLTAYVLEKALYEVRYELNNRPTWAHIPLEGALGVLGGSPE
jgi:maltose alpha-D-glucosyltransferase / alpha-amylase